MFTCLYVWLLQMQEGVVGDDSVACDSLWLHSCSAWLERNPIPATQSEWGVTQQILYSGESISRQSARKADRPSAPQTHSWTRNLMAQMGTFLLPQPSVTIGANRCGERSEGPNKPFRGALLLL